MEAKDTVMDLKIAEVLEDKCGLKFPAEYYDCIDSEDFRQVFRAGQEFRREESEARLELIRRLTARLEEVSKQLEAHGDICHKAGTRKVVEWIQSRSDIMTFINMHCEEGWNEMVANIR